MRETLKIKLKALLKREENNVLRDVEKFIDKNNKFLNLKPNNLNGFCQKVKHAGSIAEIKMYIEDMVSRGKSTGWDKKMGEAIKQKIDSLSGKAADIWGNKLGQAQEITQDDVQLELLKIFINFFVTKCLYLQKS